MLHSPSGFIYPHASITLMLQTIRSASRSLTRVSRVCKVDAPVHVEPPPRRREAVAISGRRTAGVVRGGEQGPVLGGRVEGMQVIELICRYWGTAGVERGGAGVEATGGASGKCGGPRRSGASGPFTFVARRGVGRYSLDGKFHRKARNAAGRSRSWVPLWPKAAGCGRGEFGRGGGGRLWDRVVGRNGGRQAGHGSSASGRAGLPAQAQSYAAAIALHPHYKPTVLALIPP
jgi:hypothetical protein